MTLLPLPLRRSLTVAEYAALGENDQQRSELQEGSLVMSPSPSPKHMIASGKLFHQLLTQLPAGVQVIQDIDVDLQLAAADRPGWVRQPDLVVVDQAEVDRVEAEGGLLRAACVHLIVEIVSPGSERTDRVIKRGEYADAGIPHYWIVDLTAPISVLPLHLAGELGYADDAEATGTFRAREPFELTVNLDALL